MEEELIDEGEEWNTDFYIDHYGSLKLVFPEFGSYGKFNVEVIDENGDSIFDRTIQSDYEEYVYKLTVPEGVYSIVITSYEQKINFYLKVYFKEMSNVTYGNVVKKAKSYAGKNITYDTIDAGNHGRLYGLGILGGDDSHIASELYAAIMEVQPYIDIQKKDGFVYTKLKIKSKKTVISAYYQEMDYDKIVFTSKNYKAVFKINSSKSSDKYNY